MVKQLRPIDKSQVLRIEQGAGHTCFACAGHPAGTWRLLGYDEYGQLWLCQSCWEAAPDLPRDDLQAPTQPNP